MKQGKSVSRSKAARNLISGQGKAIPLFKVFMPESVIEPLREVLMGGYVGEGPRVEEFESRLAPWLETGNVLALNNGTAALHLALRLAGVEAGDEVITTPMTCVATNEPILATGARVVWADIDPWTGNIDPEDVARKITRKTRVILCVHWGGYPCDLDALKRLARDHGLKLIEDACHALGSTYRGRRIGCHSDFACLSFQAIKMITTVDGGALTCDSPEDHRIGRLLRWYGIDRKTNPRDCRFEDDILLSGYKYHMNDVAAAIGVKQLDFLEENLRLHQTHAARYNEAFSDLKTVKLRRFQNDRTSSNWLYTMRVKNLEGFMDAMRRDGIVVSQVHARNDRYTIFKDSLTDLPGVDEFASQQVSIPVGWWLTEDQVEYIVQRVRVHDRAESR